MLAAEAKKADGANETSDLTPKPPSWTGSDACNHCASERQTFKTVSSPTFIDESNRAKKSLNAAGSAQSVEQFWSTEAIILIGKIKRVGKIKSVGNKKGLGFRSANVSALCATEEETNFCAEIFAATFYLKYWPGVLPSVCSEWNKTFKRRYELNTHRGIHTGEKPFA